MKLRSLKISDTEGRLSGNKAGFSRGVLEQDGHGSAPGTRPGSSPGPKTVDKCTTS